VEVVDPRADLVGQRAVFKTELPHLAREGADQTIVAEGQYNCCLVKTTAALTTLHKLADLSHFPIAITPMDRRNQILLISQSPGETTSELLLVWQYQDWTPKE
jgi:hypothetical protein